MVIPPRSAADPRPGNKPYYISDKCEDCGAPLVLEDLLRGVNGFILKAPRFRRAKLNPKDIWWDEWMCPVCRNGTWMDWPNSKFEELKKASEGPLTELKLPMVNNEKNKPKFRILMTDQVKKQAEQIWGQPIRVGEVTRVRKKR